MEKLAQLPLVGPLFQWLFRTRVWKVYLYLDARKWSRLAAAITFTSFLALFPTLAVAAAIGAALLSRKQMQEAQDTLAEQVPGISDQLDLQDLVDHAGTVGLIAGALLLLTGVNWVGTLRESLRSLWDLEEAPGNFLTRKGIDLGVLGGLGVVGLVSFGGSAFALTAVTWAAEQLQLAEGGVGTVLLRIAAYAAAVAASFGLLWYALTLLPGVRPPRRATAAAALQGALGFELLKLLLGGYLKGVAAKSVYGAFGVPIALLLWISFMAKLLLYCVAWTATADPEDPEDTTEDPGDGAEDSSVTAPGAASGGAPGTPPRPAP
ncbi:YhjD/YihY/BrkB family envelope integrity protein [Streptomyces boncukensis]|uniref:YihY/virulence factor BrkB family protein n=1 Tax=Streptomyces boncukensis TaxID=2711219 RepID=A0A6G4WVK0_9ACTN|nr:YhjD/YihY/BrkB family envelope integrity protein [Streptomyces boncukensis]NGO69255.1 YihY/virulence factor BrkB family protein [Streptomyces boncukensis]